MRKLKLLFAACALLVSAGVQAQSWTGSEVGEGYALLYNVGTGQYFTRGNGWGTQASIGGEGAAMTVYLQAFDGKYKIRTQNSYGVECLSGSTVYTDQSRNKNSTWTFEEIDATNHVYNIISADNHGDGSGKYLTAEGESSTIVGPGNDGTIGNAKWKVYLYTDQQAQLQTAMANATAEAPVDVSAYIKDANFGAFPDIALECWSKTVTNWNLNGGDLLNPCAETYRNGGGKIYQTIAVPNGTYKVLCQGFNRFDGGSTPSYLYANEETPVELKGFNANGEGTASNMSGASTSFTAGNYENEIQVVVTGESLTIGIEGQDGNWTCFDNFRLMYLGPLDLSEIIAAYETALGAANAVDQNSVMNKDVLKDLQDAISTYSNVNNTDQDELSAATTALTEATNNAITSIANYAEAKAILDAANNFDATGQASYASNETIAAIQTAYDNRTLEAVTAEQKAAAQTALATACKAQTEIADNSDMSVCIQNWDFLNCENDNYPGWTISKTAGYANKYGTTAVEYWNGSAANGGFDYYQTITDLPTGIYTIQGNMWNSTDGESGAAGINGECGVYGQSTSAEVFAGVTADTRDGGKATYTTEGIMILDGTLRLGVKNNATMGGRWFGVDWIKLTYVRQLTNEEIIAIPKDNYDAAVDAAQALEGKITQAAMYALNQVIAENPITEGTAAEYDNATQAINDAVAEAELLVEPYATWLTLKAKAQTLAEGHATISGAINKVIASVETLTTAEDIEEANVMTTALMTNYVVWYELYNSAAALKAVSNDNETANTTLGSVMTTQAARIAAQFNKINNATIPQKQDLIDLVNTILPDATSTLKEAMITYAGEANPVGEGSQFDLTFMLTNPDLTSFWTGAWGVSPAGWYTDQEGGNFQVMQNNSVNAEDGVHKIFMEYYFLSYNPYSTWGNGKFNIYTKATLPAGTYTMNCYAFAKEENYSSGAANPQVYFYANDTQGSLVSSNKLTEQSISFVNDSEQEVKIGLKPLDGNTYNWMGIGYVELYKVPAQSYTVDEDIAWDNTVSGAGDVTLNRTIKEGVNTLVLPFSMTQAEVEEYFGEGSTVYVVSSYEADKSSISFNTKEGISANEPCLLKATIAGTSYILADRTIVAGNPVAEGTNVTMNGSYEAIAYIPQGSYVVSGGNLYLVDTEVTLKNTRAYISIEGDGARTLTMSFGGEATGIATLEGGELKVEMGNVYDLSGRKVKNPGKGLYIMNGKKLVK